MKSFKRCFEVAAPKEALIRFHSDPRALRILKPPGMVVRFHRVEPVSEDSIADFTMWLGPLPIRWEATHFDVESNAFSDTQSRGPFAHWEHRHSFVAIDENTTQVSDEINAEPGKHLFWGFISRLMWVGAPGLFAYRTWKTKRSFLQPPRG